MFENHIIQTRGFHNLKNAAGEVIGFQFCIRSNYYKGLWLSQLRVSDAVIDGVVYPREQQIWEIGGREYTPDEMLEIGDADDSIYWQVNDVATIKIRKPGGLETGYHTLSIRFGWMCNYAPKDALDPEIGTWFSGVNNERRLLIV